jgi:hypothetical protein
MIEKRLPAVSVPHGEYLATTKRHFVYTFLPLPQTDSGVIRQQYPQQIQSVLCMV